MAKLFEYRYTERVEKTYYNHGLFMSNHPVLMICISAVVMLCCCYPLLNLPLPGSEPTEFLTPLSDFSQGLYTAGKNLPYSSRDVPVDLPQWFEADEQVAYVQQFLVKSIVNPWNEKEMILTDAYRAPIAKIFTLLEEIENFHLDEDESHSVTKRCLHVTESIIKPKQSIKPLFPEYGCLILSPASFWRKNMQSFQNDPNIMYTVHKYQGKTLETSPSVKELLFGVPSKESGVNNFIVRNRQRAVTYAITLVLKTYDHRLISALRKKIRSLYPSNIPHHGEKKCKDGTNCENSSDSGGEEPPVITHIHFKPQIGFNELIPLLSTYFIMGCYIYFSVRKINFVKSKLGMAFSAVVSIMASLMMSVGLCSVFGLTPTLNGGEIFPYLIIVIGLENILVITKSVVATPIHLEVDKRVALGLSREGCSITKNLLLELVLIGLGYFTYVPEIQEFCAFAVVGILSDYFMHMIFFTTVLSIDIRRLDITEDIYSQPDGSESEEEACNQQQRTGRENGRNSSWPFTDRRCTSVSPTRTKRKRSVLEHLRASSRRRRKDGTDTIHKVETGGKSVTILKIPKRLRVLFFWADTRMVQRGLMVFMVIWFGLLIYGDPFGNKSTVPVTPTPPQYRTATLAPIPVPTKEPFSIFQQEKKTRIPEPVDDHGNLLWSQNDLLLYRRLSFRHWPTLFAYYNLTLAGRFVSILPSIPLTVTIHPDDAVKSRHTSESSKQNELSQADSFHADDNMSQQFPPYSYTGRYPMTGLDYYLTLLLGAVSGMMMVFLLTVMYRCICTRNYANWRVRGKLRRQRGTAKYTSSIGESMPLVLSGHPQLVECITCEDGLLASTDLSGELRVWDIHTGDCTCVIHRVQTPVPIRDPAEGAIDAKPTPVGYQEKDKLVSPFYVNPYQPPRDMQDFEIASSMQNFPKFYIEHGDNQPKKGHSRQRSWHTTPKSKRTHHRSGSGGNIVIEPKYDMTSPDHAWASPFTPDIINVRPSIQTNFASLENEKSQLRKRTGPANDAPSTSATSSELSSQHSSRGHLELGEGDGNRLKRKSSDETDGSTGYDFQVNTSTHRGLFLDENTRRMWGSWESGLGVVTPKSGGGSWGSSPGSTLEMENGPTVWCMVCVKNFIVTGCENGRIEIWDAKSERLKCAHDVGKAGVCGLVAEDKKLVAARINGSLDFFSMEATFFHSTAPVQYRGPPRMRNDSQSFQDISFSDVLTLQLFHTVKTAHQQPITVFKMAMGRVLTGSCDHTLKLFTLQDGRCLFTLYGHKGAISALYMDPGPPAGAASGSSDGTIRLWDLPSGRCLHMLDEHKGEVTSVQCSDTHIVSIAQDDKLCVWTRTGMLLHVRCLDPGCSGDICLLGNSWCVTGGLGCVLLWDMRNGELVRRIQLSDESRGLSSRVSKLVLVDNLAVACDTGRELQIVRFPSVLEKVD
ncbi:sterol regulatory element-binding protein cleavage-activating protein-like isoform X2 [Styela clava]